MTRRDGFGNGDAVESPPPLLPQGEDDGLAPVLTLATLGTSGLRGVGGAEMTSVLSQPKRFALLVYLALARPRGFHRRDTLLTLFWSDLDEKRARNALSQSLSFLRSHLPPGVIITRGAEDVGVDSERLATGVEAFEAALAAGRWNDALEVYRGDFLRGFHVTESHGFEEWMDEERARLRQEAARAAWTLAQEQLERGSVLEAEQSAIRALDLGGAEEVPVRRFLESTARTGDRATAVRFFEAFCQRLHRELELEPSEETLALAAAIRKGEMGPAWPECGPPLETAAPGPVEEAPAPSQAPGESVMVGAAGAPAAGRRTGPLRRLLLYAGGAGALLAAFLVFPGRGPPQPLGPPSPDRPFTVLASTMGTADPQEREAVAFLLQTGLDASYLVHTVPVPDVARTLALMEHPEEAPLDPAAARVVGARLGVPTVVIPRLDRLGETYSLAIRVEDAVSGQLHQAVQGRAPRVDDVVGLVDSLVVELRRGLGEAPEILARTQPLPQVLTPSLEALQAYQRFREAGVRNPRTGLSYLREAVAADSAFATAWQYMATLYGTYLNQPDSAEMARRQAERFWDRLSEARRSDLEMRRRLSEDVALWDLALEEAERAVVRDPRYLNNYGVYMGFPGGLPDSALNIRFRMERAVAKNAHRFHPDESYATGCFINTHYLAAALDRMDEWLTFLDTLDIALPPDCAREAALFENLAAGNWDRADSMVLRGPGDWPWPTAVEVALLQMTPLRGRVREAHVRPPLEESETLAFDLMLTPLANIAHLLLQLAYGLPLEEAPEETFARRGAPRALEGRGWDAVTDHVLYGVRESLLGDTLEAQRVSSRLRAMRDSATSQTFEGAFAPWFTLLEVGPAYQREDWRRVIETLEPMASRIHEPKVGHLGGDDYLIWWLLAEAHEGLGDPAPATRNLEFILRRPDSRRENWMLQGFIHPAARFKLAGLYAQVGATQQAREQYRLFLDTFTDPEPEFRWMVEEARRGLAAAAG